MEVKIEETWKQKLRSEFEKPYFERLIQFVKSEYAQHKVFPAGRQIFRAFDETPFDQVKVVILGQDPYHGDGQAHGLCFSVNEGVPMPPSLVNIFKEIHDDLGKEIPPHGNLERWVKQGVLLLNATLTVRAHQAGSHQNQGWEEFTDSVIRVISQESSHVVFLLWGSYAQKKQILIDSHKHLILKAPHPSPLSSYRGFFGCKHFSQTNDYLQKCGKSPIIW